MTKLRVYENILLWRKFIYCDESDNYCNEILFIAKDCYESLREVYESDNYCDEILFITKELFKDYLLCREFYGNSRRKLSERERREKGQAFYNFRKT